MPREGLERGRERDHTQNGKSTVVVRLGVSLAFVLSGDNTMAVSYKPEGLTALTLGEVPALFNPPYTEVITQRFKGKEFMCLLPGGELYFDSKLSLDLDGSPF